MSDASILSFDFRQATLHRAETNVVVELVDQNGKPTVGYAEGWEITQRSEAWTTNGLLFLPVTPNATIFPPGTQYKIYIDGYPYSTVTKGEGEEGVTPGGSQREAMKNKSMAFIRSMLEPLIPATTASTIHQDEDYDHDYTGAVSGGFTLVGWPSDAEQLCPIQILTPDPSVSKVPDNYRGEVTGLVTVSNPTDYRVQAYKRTDADYEMNACAEPDEFGAFTMDLSEVEEWQLGEWTFALLANSDNEQLGIQWVWPAATSYVDLVIEHWVITDTEYLIHTGPAFTSGRFSFPFTQPGRKMWMLKRASTGQILAQIWPSLGNIRSYIVEPGQAGHGTAFELQCYTYDQGLCLLAAVEVGDDELAAHLANGLIQLQTVDEGDEDGGFFFSGRFMSPAFGDPSYRTGAHSIALYALLKFMEAYPDNDDNDWVDRAERGFVWLANYLNEDPESTYQGLYLGGTGVYTPEGGGQQFDPDLDLAWASTEHNLDTWFTLKLGAIVLEDAALETAADNLRDAINALLWYPAETRMYQGRQPTGPDLADPLDVHTWGAIFFEATGDSTKAVASITEANLLPLETTINNVNGFATAWDNGHGYPGAIPNVWSEGTFGAALSFYRTGDLARWAHFLAEMAKWQEPDGGFRYVIQPDSAQELTPYRCVIGPAWSVVAISGHGIWDEIDD